MKNFCKNRLALVLTGSVVLLGIAGCGETKPESDHTHLWTGDQTHNVWTYDRAVIVDPDDEESAKPDGFLKQELQSGQVVALEGGTEVSYDGTNIRIGGRVIKSANVHVEHDGSLRENAFIRASK